MRRFVLVLVGLMLIFVTMIPPVYAQPRGYAYGSCGAQWGDYEHKNLTPEMYGNLMTVPDVKFQIVWRNLSGPTTMGVIGRLNNDLDATIGVWAWTAGEVDGFHDDQYAADLRPETQGGEGSPAPRTGSYDGPATSQYRYSPSLYGGKGGILPGDYHFYIYTGEIRVTENGRRFIADEKGFLGHFSCGVADNEAKN